MQANLIIKCPRDVSSGCRTFAFRHAVNVREKEREREMQERKEQQIWLLQEEKSERHTGEHQGTTGDRAIVCRLSSCTGHLHIKEKRERKRERERERGESHLRRTSSVIVDLLSLPTPLSAIQSKLVPESCRVALLITRELFTLMPSA